MQLPSKILSKFRMVSDGRASFNLRNCILHEKKLRTPTSGKDTNVLYMPCHINMASLMPLYLTLKGCVQRDGTRAECRLTVNNACWSTKLPERQSYAGFCERFLLLRRWNQFYAPLALEPVQCSSRVGSPVKFEGKKKHWRWHSLSLPVIWTYVTFSRTILWTWHIFQSHEAQSLYHIRLFLLS